MSRTLEDYEARIERWERLETGGMAYREDEPDKPEYESEAHQAAEYLAATAREIRGIAWSAPYQAWARELVDRAVASADRIARADGRMGGYAARVFAR